MENVIFEPQVDQLFDPCIVICLYKNGYENEIHLYDLLDVLDLLDELHLCHPPDVLELPGRPDHTQQKQKQQKQQQGLGQQRGRALRARPPLLLQ